MKDNRIRALRIAAGLSQEELAARVGLTQRAISYHETGRAELDGYVIAAYSKVFRVRPRELFVEEAVEPERSLAAAT